MPLRYFSTAGAGNDGRPEVDEAEIVEKENIEFESSSTPFDDDYFATDKMPEGEQDAILGLAEFEEALTFFHKK